MEELITKLQAVRNTLEGFDIISRRETMLKLIGCQQVLDEVIGMMRDRPAEVQDGNNQAE